MRILLAAEEAAGVQALQALARSGHDVVAVMTAAVDEPRRPTLVRDLAAQLHYPTWPAKWVKDAAFAEQVRAAGVDLLLNVYSLYLICDAVLAAPRWGGYNVHPGPLPEYAGLNAVSWALYNGETRHAVTIHRMVPDVDAGPIAYQTRIDVRDVDTALTLSLKCVRASEGLVDQLLETARATPAAIPAIPQDLSRRRYFGRAAPDGGRLVWSRPARQVADFVRACDYLPFRSPWGHPRARVDDRDLAILKARALDDPATAPPGTVGQCVGRAIKVAARDRWVLVERVLCGETARDAADQLRPGQRFEAPSQPSRTSVA